MKPFSILQERMLAILATFGFLVPNGIFVYASMQADVLRVALSNPIALMFIIEALFLMALFAWLIHRSGNKYPGWQAFIILSVLGSMAFSVPAYLYLASRRARKGGPTP